MPSSQAPLVLAPVLSAPPKVTVQDKLSPPPFWKEKKKIFEQINEERRLVVTASIDKNSENLYEMRVQAAGLVNKNLQEAWAIIQKFEALPSVDERFRAVQYFPERQRLFLHMAAYGYHAKMILELKFGESQLAREMHFESVEGSFRGMKGIIRLEDNTRQKTEISMTTNYTSENLPLPKILIGVGLGSLGLEVVGQQVASQMRSFIEKN